MLLWSVLALCALAARSGAQEEPIPFSGDHDRIFASSADLIQSFRRQKPKSPELPAVIPPGRHLPPRLQTKRDAYHNSNLGYVRFSREIPGYGPFIGPDKALEAILSETASTRPNFDRSLHLRVDLSFPRSGFTEAYDIAWHADSDTARTIVENSTIIYRSPLPNGRIQFLEVKTERSNGIKIRRCTRSPPLIPTTSSDRAFPGLPDLNLFNFVGYTTEENRALVEHWQYVVIGGPGEGGAARGESLNFTHDMLIYRDRGEAVPLKYTVVTDSSVLGPVSDTYTHRYVLLPAPTAPLLPDTVLECDVLEEFKEDKQRKRRTAETVVRLSGEKNVIKIVQ